MRVTVLTLAVVMLGTITGCAAGTTPRSRVAADLGCNTSGTRVEKIADLHTDRPAARWLVTGCGRQAVYVCTTPVRDCWREGGVQTETAGYSPQ